MIGGAKSWYLEIPNSYSSFQINWQLGGQPVLHGKRQRDGDALMRPGW